MGRIPAAALAAVALAALALAARGPLPAPAAAAEPKFELRLKPKAAVVKLGERIRMDCTLVSRSARVASVAKLRIGSPASLVFYLRTGTEVRQVAKLWGKYRGNEFKEFPSDRVELRPGKTLEETVDLLAVLPGKYQVTAAYLGIEKADWPDPLESKPVEVEVGPGPKGETRVGARIRTTKGTMVAELYPEKAYNTVHNFLSLATDGFYNDKVFHRIVKDFMVQGGDPNANGTGGPGYSIPAEFNDLKHDKGVLSMAREGHPNTAGSQFFVMTAANHGLDGRYAGFGKVVEGMEVVDALASVPVRAAARGEMSDPIEKPKIEGVDLVLLPQRP